MIRRDPTAVPVPHVVHARHARHALGAHAGLARLVTGALIGLAVLAAARPAAAHPLDVGYLRVDARPGADGTAVTLVLDLEVGATATLLGGVELSSASAASGALDLARATTRLALPATELGPCRFTAVTAGVRERTVSLTEEALCPAGSTTWRWDLPFLARMPSTFQLIVSHEGVTIIDQTAPRLEIDLTAGTRAGSFGHFVWDGVKHIGAAPEEWRASDGGLRLPDGIDHILFLVALMLGGGTFLGLLGVTTGFTIGHSITLAIAALGVVRPPSSVIEPLVALTIAAAALEAMTGKLGRHRWKIATAFGLIHGFAFAAALFEVEPSTGELVRALFGYNLGVELGQVAIVAVLAPPILLLHRRPLVAKIVTRVLAGFIFAAGALWFIERTFGG